MGGEEKEGGRSGGREEEMEDNISKLYICSIKMLENEVIGECLQ